MLPTCTLDGSIWCCFHSLSETKTGHSSEFVRIRLTAKRELIKRWRFFRVPLDMEGWDRVGEHRGFCFFLYVLNLLFCQVTKHLVVFNHIHPQKLCFPCPQKFLQPVSDALETFVSIYLAVFSFLSFHIQKIRFPALHATAVYLSRACDALFVPDVQCPSYSCWVQRHQKQYRTHFSWVSRTIHLLCSWCPSEFFSTLALSEIFNDSRRICQRKERIVTFHFFQICKMVWRRRGEGPTAKVVRCRYV